MPRRNRFYLYRKEYSRARFRIGPANGIGYYVFLINLTGIIYGLHEAAGLHGYISPLMGSTLLVGSLICFVVSLVFFTDYSTPFDPK